MRNQWRLSPVLETRGVRRRERYTHRIRLWVLLIYAFFKKQEKAYLVHYGVSWTWCVPGNTLSRSAPPRADEECMSIEASPNGSRSAPSRVAVSRQRGNTIWMCTTPRYCAYWRRPQQGRANEYHMNSPPSGAVHRIWGAYRDSNPD